MVFSKSVLELGTWTVLSSYLFLTVQTASSHLDYSNCLITDQIEKNEMVGACRTNEGGEVYTEFRWGS
jgi:hypothetical protein